MPIKRATPRNIDEYIAAFPPEVQAILERIRATIRKAAPGAEETISYQIPAFTLGGALVYFAAFKRHIGLYPPVKGDAGLERAVAAYAGEKGNLRFPLDQPIPYRPRQEDRQAPGETEPGEGSGKGEEETVSAALDIAPRLPAAATPGKALRRVKLILPALTEATSPHWRPIRVLAVPAPWPGDSRGVPRSRSRDLAPG